MNCLTSAPCNISAAETFTVANKMMYYHCQRKVLYGPRCFLLVWDMLLMGVSSCLLPGRVLGSHVNPPPCKRNTFFFFSFDICCTGFCTFFFDQSACKCHPRLIGMAAFKRVSPREWCFDSQWLQLLFS